MLKTTIGDLQRALVVAICVAGLLFAIALQGMGLDAVLSPLPLGVIVLVGLAVGAFGLFYERGSAERLAMARGERMANPEDVRKMQASMLDAAGQSFLIKLAIVALILVGLVIHAVFFA